MGVFRKLDAAPPRSVLAPLKENNFPDSVTQLFRLDSSPVFVPVRRTRRLKRRLDRSGLGWTGASDSPLFSIGHTGN